MNTLIIEHADQSTTELFKQLVDKLGLRMTTKKEKADPGEITNPELLKTIDDYESGRVKPVEIDLETLRKKADHA